MAAIGIGGALVERRAAPEGPSSEEPSRHGGVLPAATFVLLIAALVHALLVDEHLGAQLTLAVGLCICGTTLIGRGALLQRRLRRLLVREQSANDRLAQDLRHDALTGLLNRRALAEDLPTLEGTPFALVLCDIDHFKAYNDRLGHLAGDHALRTVAGVVRTELRAEDAAYRYGGEEVLVVLQGLDAEAALAAADRVRQAVTAAAIPHPAGIDGVITLSFGVAAGRADAAAVLGQADRALYAAKEAGRDRVVAATPDHVPEAAPQAVARAFEDPVLRHVRGLLEVSRVAAGGDVVGVAEALAGTIRRELRFRTVAVNLCDRTCTEATVVAVVGDPGAREAQLATSCPWDEWERLLADGHERRGATWLPAGAVELDVSVWTGHAAALPHADAWHPDDMLMLPLRGAAGDLLGVVSVDEPDTGLRPEDADLELLMTVAAHGGLAIEQAQRAAWRASAPGVGHHRE
jgi:diguanylate cyclase (GGDEF)-like protein